METINGSGVNNVNYYYIQEHFVLIIYQKISTNSEPFAIIYPTIILYISTHWNFVVLCKKELSKQLFTRGGATHNAFLYAGRHHCDDDGPGCMVCLMLAYIPLMGSASRVFNAVTRSPSHESGTTNQCYTIHTVSTVLHTHHRMSLKIYNIQIMVA